MAETQPPTPEDIKGRIQQALETALSDLPCSTQIELSAKHPFDSDWRIYISFDGQQSPEVFAARCTEFGLIPEDLGRSFVWANATWILVGIAPRRRANPVMARRVPSGRSKFLSKDSAWAIQVARQQTR